MKLREINEKLQNLESLLAETGGELTDEVQQQLEKVELAENEKLENIGFLILEAKSDSEKFKLEIDRLSKLKKQADNKQKSLKQYLTWYMNLKGYDKFNTDLVKYSFRTSKSVNITDLNALPDSCIKIEKKADKTVLKELLKVGAVNGAELVENKSLQVK